MKNVENYIQNKVEEILNSPTFISIPEEKKGRMRSKMENHLEMMVIETFINRLTTDQAEKLSSLIERKPEEASQKLREFASSNPGLADDLQERIEREVEQFKSLKK